ELHAICVRQRIASISLSRILRRQHPQPTYADHRIGVRLRKHRAVNRPVLPPPCFRQTPGGRTTTPCIHIPVWATAHPVSSSSFVPNPLRVGLTGSTGRDRIFSENLLHSFERLVRRSLGRHSVGDDVVPGQLKDVLGIDFGGRRVV